MREMADLKRYVRGRQPTHPTQLDQFCQKERARIPAQYCQKFVEIKY